MNRIKNLQGTENHFPQNKIDSKNNFTQNVITHMHHESGEK